MVFPVMKWHTRRGDVMHKRKDKRFTSRILPILFVSSLCLTLLGGCAKVEKAGQADVSRFKIVEETATWLVVYDKDTKVMYTVSYGGYNSGNFTLLVDSDGKPLLWNGNGDDF